MPPIGGGYGADAPKWKEGGIQAAITALLWDILVHLHTFIICSGFSNHESNTLTKPQTLCITDPPLLQIAFSVLHHLTISLYQKVNFTVESLCTQPQKRLHDFSILQSSSPSWF